ncbi:MAG: DUF5668 domain-containing protein [Ardenticatenales bacterium]
MMSPAPRRRGVLFPVLLIAAGALVLATNFGVVRPDIWVDLLSLWPVLLIGLGLSIMLGGTRLGAFAAAVVTLALLAGGTLWLQRWSQGHGSTAPILISAPVRGLSTAAIVLAPGVAEVKLAALSSGDPNLIYGMASSGRGRAAQPSFKVTDTSGRFELTEPSPTMLGFGDIRGRIWDLAVARGVPLAVTVDGGVGRYTLDLTDVTLTSLDLDIGVGNADATLPASGRIAVKVDGGVGSLTLHLPRGLAARVAADVGVGAVHVTGIDKVGDGAWETPDFDAATDRADITLDVGVGAITVWKAVGGGP